MSATEKRSFTVEAESIGERLDLYISKADESLTRSRVQKLIDDGLVRVNGVTVPKNYKLRESEHIELEYPLPAPCRAEAEDIPIDAVYEDEDIIVINKPKGMVVHPAAGNPTGTLVSAVLHHCGGSLSGIGGVLRPGIVHRIDKDTSGLLVIAKNDAAHIFLSEEIKFHRVSRIYEAIAIGRIAEARTVDLPIGRHPTDRKRMAVTEKNSKPAVTHIEIMEGFPSATHIRCILETGRTHQIRVHLAAIGHPLLGDTVYGSPKLPLNQKYMKRTEGQALHAGKLILTHPRTREQMCFEAPRPAYFDEILQQLRGDAPAQKDDTYEKI